MPIYEYVCDECETRFEKIVMNQQQQIVCPNCASKRASLQLSVFATNGSSTSAPSSGSGGSCCGGGCGCH
jgi:putative FmdB family regulatory protein